MERDRTDRTEEPTRRNVLRLGGAGLAAAVSAPALASLLGHVGCTPPATESGELDEEGWLVLALADHAELESVGGLVLVEVADTGLTLVVVRVDDDGTYAALDAACTHAGCLVDSYDTDQGLLVCPCHASTFLPDGDVVDGPATVALESFDTEFDGEILRVDVRDV